MTSSFRTLLILLRLFRSLRPPAGPRPSPSPDGTLDALLEQAEAARAAGRGDAARALFEQALRRHPGDAGRVAAIHYELGRLDTEQGRTAAAVSHFKSALRADRGFAPAAVDLGDLQEAAGEPRDAVRTWERSVEARPALALLGRLERVHRREGRPSRMIALYRAACERAPDDLALAVGLGRVYFELEMLDEAADQFEKLEVRAPDMPVVHAFLAAIFERRGETPEAFAEYRRSLRLAHAFDWPHACAACGARSAVWDARCPRCGRPDSLRPVDPS